MIMSLGRLICGWICNTCTEVALLQQTIYPLFKSNCTFIFSCRLSWSSPFCWRLAPIGQHPRLQFGGSKWLQELAVAFYVSINSLLLLLLLCVWISTKLEKPRQCWQDLNGRRYCIFRFIKDISYSCLGAFTLQPTMWIYFSPNLLYALYQLPRRWTWFSKQC